jgi:hypothetical protein
VTLAIIGLLVSIALTSVSIQVLHR